MPDAPWKRVERAKCQELGAQRSGPTGRDTPDCAGLHVGLEIKYIKTFSWLTKYWQQAKENAAKAGLPPVLCIKERPRGRDMVQMGRDLWLELEGRARDAVWGGLGELPQVVTLPVDGELVARMPWNYFVALYRAAYNKEEVLV